MCKGYLPSAWTGGNTTGSCGMKLNLYKLPFLLVGLAFVAHRFCSMLMMGQLDHNGNYVAAFIMQFFYLILGILECFGLVAERPFALKIAIGLAAVLCVGSSVVMSHRLIQEPPHNKTAVAGFDDSIPNFVTPLGADLEDLDRKHKKHNKTTTTSTTTTTTTAPTTTSPNFTSKATQTENEGILEIDETTRNMILDELLRRHKKHPTLDSFNAEKYDGILLNILCSTMNIALMVAYIKIINLQAESLNGHRPIPQQEEDIYVPVHNQNSAMMPTAPAPTNPPTPAPIDPALYNHLLMQHHHQQHQAAYNNSGMTMLDETAPNAYPNPNFEQFA